MVFNPFLKMFDQNASHFKSKGFKAQSGSQDGKSQAGLRYPKNKQTLIEQAMEVVVPCHLGEKNSHLKFVFKKRYVPTSEQPKLVTTTFSKSNPFHESHDLWAEITQQDSQQDDEVDIAGAIVDSWSTEERDTTVEPSVKALITEEYLDGDSEATVSEVQVVCQVSNVTQAAVNVQQTSSHPQEVPISKALSPYRPCTYLEDVKHLFQPMAPLVSQASASTTLVSPALSLPRSVTSTTLVLYRPPVHLDRTFIHSLTWSHLLASATSPAEQFWQGVLSESCARIFWKSIFVDGLAALRATSDYDITSSGCMLDASDVAAKNTLVADARFEKGAVFSEGNENAIVQPNDSLIPLITAGIPFVDEASSDILSEEAAAPPLPGPKIHAQSIVEDNLEVIKIVPKILDELEHDDPSKSRSIQSFDRSEASSVDQTSPNHDVEKQQLQEDLQQQQSLCHNFRSQLVECEVRLEEADAKWREAERQRGMYEVESEHTSHQLGKVLRELSLIQKQLAAEKSKPVSVAAAQQTPQSAAGSNVPAIMAARDRAEKQAQVARNEKNFLEEMLNAVIHERDEMKRQLQSPQQIRAQEMSRVSDINDYLRANIAGLEGQVTSLVQQKQESDNRVLVLEACNKTLLTDFTNKLIADPRDLVDPVTCTHNEARDLRQQVESSQATSARFIEANKGLHKELQQAKERVLRLEGDRDQLEHKCGRLSASFEVLERNVESWKLKVPDTLRSHVSISEDEMAAADEQMDHLQVIFNEMKQRLKEAALEVSEFESKKASMERLHNSELAHRDKAMKELRKDHVRLDVENFEMDRKLQDAQAKIKQLEIRFDDATKTAQEWREQCENRVFDEVAHIVRGNHRYELRELEDQVHALQHANTELRLGKERAVDDHELYKWWFANTIIKIEEWEAEWLLARAKCDAMEERYEHDLRGAPLRIQKHDRYENLSSDTKMQILRNEDRWVEIATGVNIGRGVDRQPYSDVWSNFLVECQAWRAQRNGQAPMATPTTAEGEVTARQV